MAAGLAAAPAPGRFHGFAGISGGGVLTGLAAEPEAEVWVPLPGGARCRPVLAEPGHLAGQNVLLGLRNEEPPEVVRDWFRYHVERHGATAALVVDRARPGSAEALSGQLGPEDLGGLERLLIVESPVPLGRPDLPPEAHPFNAPDAPGKDRMDVPPPDPWRAPLGELSLFELLRRRFLSEARAVANLDVSDLLEPSARVFERVGEAPGGIIALLGERIYPWRVRKGQAPTFGDHICRPFDLSSVHRRWCLAPALIPDRAVWRYVRVGRTAPKESARFFRAMAIRHPGVPTSKIVPKTSLVESDELSRLSQSFFNFRPVRPKASASRLGAAPRPAAAAGRTCIVTTMKNEGPFILEWVAYHRAIGVDDFLVYTNDCTDGTNELLDVLQARGLVQRRDNPFRGTGLKPQHAALQAAEDEEVVRNAGWAICMDVDEFINVHVGQGRLADLYEAVGDANLISLTWRLFGNADIARFEDRFVIEQFTRCAPEFVRKPHQAWGFKTLFRNLEIYKKMGVHRPKGLKPDLWDQIRWVNGSGRPMPRTMLRNGWRSTPETYGYDLVTLNHYAVRSAESFLVKRDRGRVNHVERDQGLAYWFRMNMNAEEDRSILAKLPRLKAEWSRLMADAEIRAAHEFCVARHREKIAELH
ncbi:MAG: glycosyltransferase family 2 protein, partial [Alphaproteobacteria bacterium]